VSSRPGQAQLARPCLKDKVQTKGPGRRSGGTALAAFSPEGGDTHFGQAEQKLDWPQRAAQKLSPHPGRAVAPPHSPCAVCNLCNCTQALVQLLGP
jgi:hypothetical protein